LLQLEKIKTYHTFKKGGMINCVGEKTQLIGTLITGIAAIYNGLQDGRQQIVGFIK